VFQYPWRDYQQRVLDELEDHLNDGHLHVVAAPGSGKTILGLEVMRQINAPTLILAPTITIRNQWVERISMFLPVGVPPPDWISKSLKNPDKLTVITYQALHAAFSGEEEEEDIGGDEEEGAEKKQSTKKKVLNVSRLLRKHGIKTLILDEAHHLRKEWWKALTRLKEELEDVQIVALTATPPYDVDYTEWQKYQELCGPIDTEISVPELVLQGDLCPHQDYVHFSLPQGKEAEKLHQFKADIGRFLEQIRLDENFLDIFSAHPWVYDTHNRIEEILDEPAFFSAIIIFMHAAGMEIPRYALNILGISRTKIPPLNAKWLETLFTGILYSHAEHFKGHEDKLEATRKELKRIGAIERKKVIIDNTRQIQKLLASSLGKLESIVDITRAEAENMGDSLRMVVLADYIRKGSMPSQKGGEKPINKIGVVPIFEYLRRSYIKGVKLGVLTGSLIIIPHEAQEALIKVAAENGVDKNRIRFHTLLHDEKFLRVDIAGENRQIIVRLMTEVFSQGAITALIGTQALLGEGWDAPSVNTLILASYVGSYMLSNQMRGRAIRIDPARANKVANIWHLVALDIETIEEKIKFFLTGESKRQQFFDPFDEIKQDLGHDIKTLRRRFRAFEGLSFTTPPIIENGFKRLALSKAKWDKNGIKQTNQQMLERAKARDKLPHLWNEALRGKNPKPEMHEKVETNDAPNGLAFMDTLKYMVMNALIAGVGWASYVMNIRTDNARGFVIIMMIFFVVALFYAAPRLLKALWLLFRNGSIAGSVEQVGWCVLETLHHMRIVKTNLRNLNIQTVQDKMGIVYCRLDGATNVEKRYFMEAMEEALGAIDNPRYLMVRRSYLGRFLRVDYHAIPTVIGQNKKYAEYYAKRWKRYVGHSDLVYTRSKEGRLALLKARTSALSSAFRKKTNRISQWE